MKEIEIIKEDIIGALLTLGQCTLSDKQKIEECDKILIETLNYIDSILTKQTVADAEK